MAKKKQDFGTEVYAETAARLAEQIDLHSGPEDGTVVRFDYTFDGEDERNDWGKKIKRRYYTYVAVWIRDAAKWYLTGVSNGLPRELKNDDFMVTLASGKTRRVQVATVFDKIKR